LKPHRRDWLFLVLIVSGDNRLTGLAITDEKRRRRP
jgi:hypothetical protein